MKKILLIVFGISACVNIYLWPKNKYEWMGVSVSELPEDGNTAMYKLFAALPIVLLFVCALFTEKKERVIVLLGSCLLFLLWIYKFLF